ncbi:MAG TPA: hypothetical protein VKT80_03195 [Chloroflexota bacterium]|nr:hypothetical protein [Chloroflexota bacterium]
MDRPANSPIIERIQREAGIPGLVDALVERLNPTDLQSLLLEVYRRRATRVKPNHLLERYEQDRFVRPTTTEPARLTEFDRLSWSLLPDSYVPIELSPVCPLGTLSAIATVDQNKAVTTIRNTEVVADPTNVLALECASRRRRLLRADRLSAEPVRLATSQRLVRGQAYRSPLARAHFRLFGLVTAGRDQGGFRFEVTSLVEHVGFYLRLLRELGRLGYVADRVRVALTNLEPERERALDDGVLQPLRHANPGVQCDFDPDRESGRGYYVGACFKIYATNPAGTECELIDGGFTTWTRQLLSNAKERLLISGLGVEVLFDRFA